MRYLPIFALALFVAACAGATRGISEGPSPVSVLTSALALSWHGMEPLSGGAADPSFRGPDRRPRHAGTLSLSLMNVTDQTVGLDRVELQPLGTSPWRIDPVRQQVGRRLAPREEIVVELSVDAAPRAVQEQRDVARMMTIVVLDTGEAYRVDTEVPVVERLR